VNTAPTTIRSRWQSPLIVLAILAAITEAAYLLVAFWGQSLHIEGEATHSLLVILGLFAIAFACYLWAIRISLAADQSRQLLALVVTTGLIFRLTLLFSNPIEEIDLYRYLWDGQATVAGVSPFRYSPQQVLRAPDEELPVDLAKLVTVRQTVPGMPEILDRVHYGELPTIYPPASQAVFALATICTPPSAAVTERMTFMKAWFVAFDMATIALLVWLLRWAGKPVGWVTAYAWCPLLIKEVANSGHLDALAVFLSTAAFCLACRALWSPVGVTSKSVPTPSPFAIYLAAIALALASGAKFFPIVWAPLFAVTTYRKFGWRTALGASCLGTITVAIILWPMWPRTHMVALSPLPMKSTADELPPLPPPELGTTPRDPTQSLRAFLSEWEMNDFLFLIVMENVRPTDQVPVNEVAWFSIVPDSWRQAACSATASIVGVEIGRAPFFLSRSITSCVFLAIAFGLALRNQTSKSAEFFLEAAFLTIAWFWLLLPTQNPWYWTWALPLLPFARSRAWLVLSGLAMIYYVRFWLTFHFPSTPLLGTAYSGPQFFDYIVTWLEFGPWFVVLALTSIRHKT
jgi:hypothetical protein